MFMFKKKYNINYHGHKDAFSNALDSYCEGDAVELVYNEFANDTDYEFDVANVENTVSFDPRRGFVIEFIMPDHDVEVLIKTENALTGFEEDDD